MFRVSGICALYLLLLGSCLAMGHPVALESLLHFVPIRAFLIRISNNDPFFLPDMAEPVEDKEESKGQELGWNKAGPADEGVLRSKLLGQVNVNIDDGGHTACYLKAV